MLELMKARIDALGLNLYRLAIMTDAGIQSWAFQPSNACNNSYSVAKAFTMTAVGLLWDRGQLRTEEKIADILELPADADPNWAEVTVEHALKHRIGFSEGFLDIDSEDIFSYGTDDFLSLVLRHPLPYAPGEHHQYSDAAYYLLSRVVEARAGVTLDALLMEELFLPLAFQEVAWSRCPQGHPMGATGLYIRAQDMVKLGWLYLNGGRWGARRILSEEWVNLALERGYELERVGKTPFIGKGGMNGQMLIFDPERRVAAAWHAYDPSGKTRYLVAMLARAALVPHSEIDP